MTWDDFKIECEGHLTSLNEIKKRNVNSESSNTIFPSSRFWVGHRIWSYINYQFGKKKQNSFIMIIIAVHDVDK